MFGSGKFDEGFDIFRTPAATACVFQAELGFDLTRHHNACTSCVTDFGIGNSLAQAQIHNASIGKNDYEKHSQYATIGGICQQGATFFAGEPVSPLLSANLEGGFELADHVPDLRESRLPESLRGHIDIHGGENAFRRH